MTQKKELVKIKNEREEFSKNSDCDAKTKVPRERERERGVTGAFSNLFLIEIPTTLGNCPRHKVTSFGLVQRRGTLVHWSVTG